MLSILIDKQFLIFLCKCFSEEQMQLVTLHVSFNISLCRQLVYDTASNQRLLFEPTGEQIRTMSFTNSADLQRKQE